MKAGAFRIVPFVNPSGETVHRLSGWDKDGQRVRKNFSTYEAALSEQTRLQTAILNEDTVPTVQTRLTRAQIEEAETAFRLLNGRSLLLAVQFFGEHYKEPLEKKPAQQAYAAFILAKQTEKKLRPRALQNLRSRVGSFIALFPERVCVHEIPEATVQAAVFKDGISARTATNNLSALNNFFRFCQKRRWVQSNPLANAERPRNDDKTPEILTLAQVRKLLTVAASYKDGRLVPYLTLGLFAAIRPAEVARLTWDDIKGLDTDTPFAVIRGEAAKKRKRRTVALSQNLMEWLRPHVLKRTPFVGKNFDRDWNRLRFLAGFDTEREKNPELQPWPDDVLRHTGITHKLNETGNDSTTSLWAGNRPDTIHDHYKGLAGEAESKAFWSICPADAKKKILKLKAAA